MSVRIAHGLFVWQEDRPSLEACLRSTAGVVDEVIMADGLIAGVPNPHGLPETSDLGWLADPLPFLPRRIPINTRTSPHPWRGLSHACTWILDKARDLEIDWLLYIDGDQELHDDGTLRRRLSEWPHPVFPIVRVDNGVRHPVPWQCVRVDWWRHYVSGCYVLEAMQPPTFAYNLVPEGASPPMTGGPWISHHPERRPPWRRDQRLGQVETVLEPPPADAKPCPPSWLVIEARPVSEAVDSGALPQTPEWFCDQCGARYFGPGTCSNQHPPAELQHDAPAGEISDTATETIASDTPGHGGDAVEAIDAGAAPEPQRDAPASEDPGTAIGRLLNEAHQALTAAAEALEQAGWKW